MTKGRLGFLLLAPGLFLLLAGSMHLNRKTTVAANVLPAQLLSLASPPTPAFNVCKGTFALCTKAPCDPVIKKTADGTKTIEFSCACKAQVGYSAGPYVPNSQDQCQDVPTAGPSPGQKIPSRYSPITSYVACTNHRAWAWCLNMPCTVDNLDKTKATCACQVASGEPYIAVPPDGQYSQTGCTEKYVSSATIQDVLHITEFLTTPEGKNLRPSVITLLVPTPTPTPVP